MRETERRKVVKACIKVKIFFKYVFFQIASDVFINNGVWDLADKMTQNDHTVYLYSFDYYNPYGFGIVGFLFPFKGNLIIKEV